MAKETITRAEYQALMRQDFCAFIQRCFHQLNPHTGFLMNWHIEVIAAKLEACRQGKIRRLIINVPPRSLKSLCASVALPAWCLGHDPAAQVLCVSYAQDLSDKLARDCRSVMASAWYRRLFRTRLSAHKQSVGGLFSSLSSAKLRNSLYFSCLTGNSRGESGSRRTATSAIASGPHRKSGPSMSGVARARVLARWRQRSRFSCGSSVRAVFPVALLTAD